MKCQIFAHEIFRAMPVPDWLFPYILNAAFMARGYSSGDEPVRCRASNSGSGRPKRKSLNR